MPLFTVVVPLPSDIVNRSSSDDDDGGVATSDEHTGIANAATVLGDSATDHNRSSVMDVSVSGVVYASAPSWPIVTGYVDSGLPTLAVDAACCTAPSTNSVMIWDERSTVNATWCHALSSMLTYD